VDDDYLEAVLDLVDLIPPGRVMTYGIIAEVVVDRLVAAGERPRGGPRQVGQVLARAGSAVPWWRVVNASGRPPAAHLHRALEALQAESTPLSADGLRVALRSAIWWPDDDVVPPRLTTVAPGAEPDHDVVGTRHADAPPTGR
jgi:alkylated DNA nucleotide flippase Atl1